MAQVKSPVLRVKTPSFAHHSLAFSPFFEDRLAVASGANFGLVGNGRVHIITLGQGGLAVTKWFDTQDSVYDIAWNEQHEWVDVLFLAEGRAKSRNQLVAACGNGSLRMFDLTHEGLPTRVWHEHSAEVSSVEWNNLQKDSFVSASWDHTVKIWNSNRQTSLLTIPAHQAQIYSATWSPHTPSMFATSAADGLVHIFDIRTQVPEKPIQSFQASPEEVLSCDWNKYDISTLATGGKDRTVKVWDMRSGRSGCVAELRGHTLAVKKVQWTTKPPSQRAVHADHTEFCMGAAWAFFDPGLLASCAWDQEVHLFKA